MIRQDDKRFSDNPNIAEYGCVLFCYLFLSNKLAGTELGVEEIKGFIATFLQNDFIDDQMTVKQPDQILGRLGVTESADVTAEGPDYVCHDGEYEICFWGYTDKDGKWWEHAIVGDGQGHQAFDPLGRSHCGRLGKIVTKRIIHVSDPA